MVSKALIVPRLPGSSRRFRERAPVPPGSRATSFGCPGHCPTVAPWTTRTGIPAEGLRVLGEPKIGRPARALTRRA